MSTHVLATRCKDATRAEAIATRVKAVTTSSKKRGPGGPANP